MVGQRADRPHREAQAQDTAPNSGAMKPGLITVTLMACMAAMPSASGLRPSAAITKFEKAKNAPPTSPHARAVTRVVAVTRSLIGFVQPRLIA